MALANILIEGYRSLKSVNWSPAPLNVLIGQNGSGKSNLLRALSLLQTAVTSQEFAKDVLREGGLANILWDGQATDLKWLL
ncbi:MAG TPA: AAA family ATPase, partial [Candidatus Binataceae bacterium]|nr:AAA family ATPase [Candidatus Binataceae bacterium]